ncbi:hypothetical protein PR048_011322 [Dryococelus australis]|uniref:Uncharacterized protein n=1 Tax=Dryococelus australis TaxID=614101 RepID=A0ABQ9HM04_9NEOP|nr:hypothetical protein PR048_011322 [Dryococelus australis]
MIGYSFLPPDRVFGKIEKPIRSHEVLSDPKDYVHVFAEHGSTIHLGTQCLVYDSKAVPQDVTKPMGQWHFKFAACKWLSLIRNKNDNNVLIYGEMNYHIYIRSYKTTMKRAKHSKDVPPVVVTKCIQVNTLKLRDVNNLLSKHFEANWHDLKHLEFYKHVLQLHRPSNDQDISEGATNDGCELMEEDAAYFV